MAIITLPPELWLSIFHLAASDLHPHISNHYTPFDQSHKLVCSLPPHSWHTLRLRHSIASVCRLWRSLAKELLLRDLVIINETQAQAILDLLTGPNSPVKSLWFTYPSSSQTKWRDTSILPRILRLCSSSLESLYMANSPKGPMLHHPEFWQNLIPSDCQLSALKTVHWHTLRSSVEDSCINTALDQVSCRAPQLEFLVLSPMVASGLFRMNQDDEHRPDVIFPSLQALAITNGMSLDDSLIKATDVPRLHSLIIDQRAVFLHPTGPSSSSLLQIVGPQLQSLELTGTATMLSIGGIFDLCPNLEQLCLRIDHMAFFPSGQEVHRNLKRIKFHSHWLPFAKASEQERSNNCRKVAQQFRVFSNIVCPKLEELIISGGWSDYLIAASPTSFPGGKTPVDEDGVPIMQTSTSE